MSDPGRQELDSIGLAPTGLHERNDWNPNPSGRAEDGPDGSQREPYETVVHLRTVEDREARAQRQPDIFAEAVAKAMQEQLEPEFVEAPSVLKNRHQVGAAGKSAAAAGVAALIALAFVVVSQESAEEGALSALPTWQSLKSSLFPAPQGKPAPMLAVRDGSGPVNEPLSLGVRINPPGRGATITIGKMPDGARLTVGRRVNDSEWRVPAQEISNAAMVPPADFVGDNEFDRRASRFRRDFAGQQPVPAELDRPRVQQHRRDVGQRPRGVAWTCRAATATARGTPGTSRGGVGGAAGAGHRSQ